RLFPPPRQPLRKPQNQEQKWGAADLLIAEKVMGRIGTGHQKSHEHLRMLLPDPVKTPRSRSEQKQEGKQSADSDTDQQIQKLVMRIRQYIRLPVVVQKLCVFRHTIAVGHKAV